MVQQPQVRAHQQAPPPVATANFTNALGQRSVNITCPNCGKLIATSVRSDGCGSTKAWLFCLGINLVAPCGCCLIPFCMDDCMVHQHDCPSCNAHIGDFGGKC